MVYCLYYWNITCWDLSLHPCSFSLIALYLNQKSYVLCWLSWFPITKWLSFLSFPLLTVFCIIFLFSWRVITCYGLSLKPLSSNLPLVELITGLQGLFSSKKHWLQECSYYCKQQKMDCFTSFNFQKIFKSLN